MKLALAWAAAFVTACGTPGVREPTGETRQFVISREPLLDIHSSPLMRLLSVGLSEYGFEDAGTTDGAFATGDVIDLFELELPDPTMFREEGVVFHSFVGANPVPSPCSDPDPSCGRHLDGNGRFDVVEDRGMLRGQVGEPIEMTGGSFLVHVNVFDTLIDLRLIGAHVVLDDVVGDVVKGHVTGGLDAAGFEQLATAWQPLVMAIVERDCKLPDLPDCGCVNMGENDGHTFLKWFDAYPRDCRITAREIVESGESGVLTWVTPTDGKIDGVPVRHFGVNFEAVPATFDR